jgi:hypothetical protein
VNPVVTNSPPVVSLKKGDSARSTSITQTNLDAAEADARESIRSVMQADAELQHKEGKTSKGHKKSAFKKTRRMSLEAERKLNRAMKSFGEDGSINERNERNFDFEVDEEGKIATKNGYLMSMKT